MIGMLPPYIKIEACIQKSMMTLDTFKGLVESDIESTFTTPDGSLDMEKLRECVSNALAVRTRFWRHFLLDQTWGQANPPTQTFLMKILKITCFQWKKGPWLFKVYDEILPTYAGIISES